MINPAAPFESRSPASTHSLLMLLHPSAILPTRDLATIPATLLEHLGKLQPWETALSNFPSFLPPVVAVRILTIFNELTTLPRLQRR